MKLNQDELLQFAKVVEHGVFQSLMNAYNTTDERQQKHWFNHADKLETKFKTEFGRHYASVIYD